MTIGRVEEVSPDGQARVIYDADNRVETPCEEGTALLRHAEDFIRRYLVLPPSALLPVALWGKGTHLFPIFDCFPYLAVVSPTKQCGKTRLLEVLGLMCSDAERTSNISEAALFRLIEQHHPTLLLDEMEQLREKGERAQILRKLAECREPARCRSDSVRGRRREDRAVQRILSEGPRNNWLITGNHY